MPEDLSRAVRAELLPALAPLGFAIVESHVADSFDNAYVTLQSDHLRIRILRERGQVSIDFGPQTEPGVWFDSDVVMQHLGLSTEGGIVDSDASRALRAVASLVAACRSELTRMFDQQRLAITKKDLEMLKERRAERLFGWRPNNN